MEIQKTDLRLDNMALLNLYNMLIRARVFYNKKFTERHYITIRLKCQKCSINIFYLMMVVLEEQTVKHQWSPRQHENISPF